MIGSSIHCADPYIMYIFDWHTHSGFSISSCVVFIVHSLWQSVRCEEGRPRYDCQNQKSKIKKISTKFQKEIYKKRREKRRNKIHK